jgi:hypothetical protein
MLMDFIAAPAEDAQVFDHVKLARRLKPLRSGTVLTPGPQQQTKHKRPARKRH